MDVRCSICSTEYEFDDDKVSGVGVTVKCSTCGHVFKVAQPEEQMPAPISAVGSGNSDWLVQKNDGTVVRFKELTSLQKWIVEQKVERSDQISKTGQTWKRLGEIAELASFFQVVDAANVAVVQPTMPSVLQRTPAPQAQPVAATPAPEYFMDAANLSEAAELSVLDDDDPLLQWQRRKVALFLAVTTLFALGGAVFLKPDETRKLLAPLLVALGQEEQKNKPLSDGDRKKLSEQVWVALQSGRFGPNEKSLRSLEAVPNREDPFVQALVSILHIELAKIESERVRLLKLQSGKTRAVQSAQDSAKSHLTLADENTNRARRHAPTNPWVMLASAALHGSANRPAEMQADLDGLGILKNPLPALVLKEASVLPSLTQAQKALVTKSEDEIGAALALVSRKDFAEDARFVYLESALRIEKLEKNSTTKNDVDGVIKEADALLAMLAPFHISEHDDVRGSVQAARLQLLQEHIAKQKAGVSTDAGVQVAAKTDVDDDNSTPTKEGVKKTEKEGVKKTKGTEAEYQRVLRRADRARIADRTRSSLKLYKKAHQLREHEAKPLVGMGWAYIDLGRASKAVGVFKHARVENPSVVVAQFGLAEAYGLLGEKAAAIRAYKKYLRIAPGGSDAADAKAALKRLQR
ncbi:MAG: hypothetical protein GY822_04125 [Deltaproteobacteria bacterium]|nr:hypothetical protein [Deltaproteobacteria bacterium]